jgi:hypothetical protein
MASVATTYAVTHQTKGNSTWHGITVGLQNRLIRRNIDKAFHVHMIPIAWQRWSVAAWRRSTLMDVLSDANGNPKLEVVRMMGPAADNVEVWSTSKILGSKWSGEKWSIPASSARFQRRADFLADPTGPSRLRY